MIYTQSQAHMRMYAHMSTHVCMCVTAECIILHVLCMCVDTGAPMAGRIMSLQQPHQNLIYSHEDSVLGKQDAESLEGAGSPLPCEAVIRYHGHRDLRQRHASVGSRAVTSM